MGWLETQCYSNFTSSFSGGALRQSSGALWGQVDFGKMGKLAIPVPSCAYVDARSSI